VTLMGVVASNGRLGYGWSIVVLYRGRKKFQEPGTDCCPPPGLSSRSRHRNRLEFAVWYNQGGKADRNLEYGTTFMKTVSENAGMDPALKAMLQEACDKIAKGIFPTMEERKAAAAEIDRLRENNARIFGIQDVTLDAVRESRAGR
jgi:hypothetical protein